MAREFYVADDGSIHSHPITVANTPGNHINMYVPVNTTANTQERTEFIPIRQVSEGRVVSFWIISIIVSVLIAIGVTQGFGTQIYGNDGGFAATIGPIVVFAGAIAGNILYGIFCAKTLDYNLWAYILSALSSVGGIIIVGIAVTIICIVAMILFYILIIGLVLAVICGIAGGA